MYFSASKKYDKYDISALPEVVIPTHKKPGLQARRHTTKLVNASMCNFNKLDLEC